MKTRCQKLNYSSMVIGVAELYYLVIANELPKKTKKRTKQRSYSHVCNSEGVTLAV